MENLLDVRIDVLTRLSQKRSRSLVLAAVRLNIMIRIWYVFSMNNIKYILLFVLWYRFRAHVCMCVCGCNKCSVFMQLFCRHAGPPIRIRSYSFKYSIGFIDWTPILIKHLNLLGVSLARLLDRVRPRVGCRTHIFACNQPNGGVPHLKREFDRVRINERLLWVYVFLCVDWSIPTTTEHKLISFILYPHTKNCCDITQQQNSSHKTNSQAHSARSCASFSFPYCVRVCDWDEEWETCIFFVSCRSTICCSSTSITYFVEFDVAV